MPGARRVPGAPHVHAHRRVTARARAKEKAYRMTDKGRLARMMYRKGINNPEVPFRIKLRRQIKAKLHGRR